VSTQRVVVVGAGLAGLSTAWHLVRLGATDVVVVEREREIGTQASAQNAAIVRTAIDDAPMETLARMGARFLNDPPAGFAPRRLVAGNGLLVLSSKTLPSPHGKRVEAEYARQMLPTLGPKTTPGTFFADEGLVDVRALITAFAAGARSAGVRFVLGAGVRAIRPGGCGVELASGETIEADQCVIAAGAWAAPLGRAIGSRVELTPTRRHLLVTRADDAIDPRWPVVWSDDDEFYARPEAGGWMLCPCDEDEVDPDQLAVSVSALESVRAKAAHVIPASHDAPAARFWAGLRTHAADRRFVIGRDPEVPHLIWAAGLGGHGVTCAAAVGELAASAVLRRELPRDLAEPFSPARGVLRHTARG
jgi:glycine/D-amino acid oxidase-like deaminating enzyme